VKARPTKRNGSAVVRVGRSTAGLNYSAWSGGIAALLDGNPLINTWLQPGAAPAERRRAVSTACHLHKKPLKRFPASTRHNPGLKPGVNEKKIVQTASEQSGARLICQTVSGESPAPISATPSRKLDAKQIVQALPGQSSTLQFRQTLESEIEKTRRLLESRAKFRNDF
jgi:hypothetical protein